MQSKRLIVLYVGYLAAVTGLFLLAWFFAEAWLWIAAGTSLALLLAWGLHRISTRVWEESGDGGGRMFFLPRPSGMGGEGRPGFSTGFPNAIFFRLKRGKPGMPSETEGYTAETAWTSSLRKEDPERSSDNVQEVSSGQL